MKICWIHEIYKGSIHIIKSEVVDFHNPFFFKKNKYIFLKSITNYLIYLFLKELLNNLFSMLFQKKKIYSTCLKNLYIYIYLFSNPLKKYSLQF